MFLDLGFLGFFSTDTEKKKKSLEKHALLKCNFLQKKKKLHFSCKWIQKHQL